MDDEELEKFLEEAIESRQDNDDLSNGNASENSDSSDERKRNKRNSKFKRLRSKRNSDSDSETELKVEGPEPPPKPDPSDSDSDQRAKKRKEDVKKETRDGSRRRRSRTRSRERSRDREREKEKRRRESSRERRREEDRRKEREREDRRREAEREERMRRLEKERRAREKERRDREDRDKRRQEEERKAREKERRKKEEREEKERERRREERKKREKEEEEKVKKDEEEKKRRRELGPTLTDIMLENPGMSMQEALQKLAEYSQQRLAAQNAAQAAQTLSQSGFQLPFSMATLPLAGLSIPVPTMPLPNPSLTKPYRDIYVGNLPQGTTGPALQEALSALMTQMGLITSPGNPILSTWISSDSHYAFCEFRTIEEANNALALNGMMLGVAQLKVGRPKNYVAPGPAELKALGINPQSSAFGVAQPTTGLLGNVPGGIMAGAAQNLFKTGLPGLLPAAPAGLGGALGGLLNPLLSAPKVPTSRVLMITNLPTACDASQVQELVKPFGNVTRFNLLMDSEGNSKGTAVFEYEDLSTCEMAIKGLNDLAIGEKKLHVQSVPEAMAETLLKPVLPKPAADESGGEPTRVICLVNMVAPEELEDDQEYEDIKEDVADECNKFGTVRSLEIPRPMEGAQGVGKVFVEFADTIGSSKARKSLSGRTFANKKVEATFFPENLFEQKIFELSGSKPSETVQEDID